MIEMAVIKGGLINRKAYTSLSTARCSLAQKGLHQCLANVLAFSTGILLSRLLLAGKSVERAADPAALSCPPTTDWLGIDAGSMTHRQLIDYLAWTNRGSCQLVHDFGGVMIYPPSGIDGQKAVCLDAGLAPKVDDCVVYSFGIDNEWSFDEAMEQYGCSVFAFDPSMNKRDHEHSAKIRFFNMGLLQRDEDSGFNRWKFRTLSSIHRMLQPVHGDVDIDYLKIDIEGAEWDVLGDVMASGMLARVRQLGVEIHLSPANYSVIARRARILQSLEKQGMVRFDSKLNPWSRGRIDEFDFTEITAYELAWYNSRLRGPFIPFIP